jgi:uncharacterized protein YjaG (DUF416 family)
MFSQWYLHNEAFQSKIDRYLEDAKRRDIFNGDAITELQQEHKSEKSDNIGILSAITTAEIWFQRFIDK